MVCLLVPLYAREDAATALDAQALRHWALEIAFWLHLIAPLFGANAPTAL
jgi:hypothetical protein